MMYPWQPSGCNARVSTAWGAATKASGPKLKTWAKSAENPHFLMDNSKFWRRNSNLFDRKITLFDGQIRLFDSLLNHVRADSSFVWLNDGKTKHSWTSIVLSVLSHPIFVSYIYMQIIYIIYICIIRGQWFDSLSEHVWTNSSFVRFNGKTTQKPTFLNITSTVSTQPSNLWTIYIDNMGSTIWAIAI